MRDDGFKKQTDLHTLDQVTETQVNQALDQSIEQLSPEVRRRLNRIRVEAVEAKSGFRPLLQTAGAISFLLVLTLGWQLWPVKESQPLPLFAEELHEDPQLLEDLEFVYWMAEENISEKL